MIVDGLNHVHSGFLTHQFQSPQTTAPHLRSNHLKTLTTTLSAQSTAHMERLAGLGG